MSTGVHSEQAIVRVPAGIWHIDPAHSSVEFQIKHTMIATVKGRFTSFEGVIKDVRECIRRLGAEGLTVKPTPGHYHVCRDGKPLRKASGMPVTLPFSPDTTRWRRTAILDLRRLGIDVSSRVTGSSRGVS